MSKYSLDPIAANCYPGTTVLVNKFGIRDDEKLLKAEIAITQEAAARWEQSPQFGSFDFAHYKAIHKHLLEDLYDWAGQVRDVNISKKGTRFCPYGEIEGQAERIFARLLNKDCLRGLTKGRFVSEFVDLYVATNYLHPFREGNGRTQRLYLSQLARNAGYSLDFADIGVDELMIATIQSSQGVINGLSRIFAKAIKEPQKKSLSEKIQQAKTRVEYEETPRPARKGKSKGPER